MPIWGAHGTNIEHHIRLLHQCDVNSVPTQTYIGCFVAPQSQHRTARINMSTACQHTFMGCSFAPQSQHRTARINMDVTQIYMEWTRIYMERTRTCTERTQIYTEPTRTYTEHTWINTECINRAPLIAFHGLPQWSLWNLVLPALSVTRC